MLNIQEFNKNGKLRQQFILGGEVDASLDETVKDAEFLILSIPKDVFIESVIVIVDSNDDPAPTFTIDDGDGGSISLDKEGYTAINKVNDKDRALKLKLGSDMNSGRLKVLVKYIDFEVTTGGETVPYDYIEPVSAQP